MKKMHLTKRLATEYSACFQKSSLLDLGSDLTVAQVVRPISRYCVYAQANIGGLVAWVGYGMIPLAWVDASPRKVPINYFDGVLLQKVLGEVVLTSEWVTQRECLLVIIGRQY